MACSTCHTAWPALNAFGRQYKEHGYRLGHLEAPNKTISKDLKWDENLPVSVILVARPYDKKGSATDAKNRALHEVELMVAGPGNRVCLSYHCHTLFSISVDRCS